MVKLFVLMIGFLIGGCGAPVLAQPAPECLKNAVVGGNNVWQNTCDETISVAYCSTGRPIWGKTCGAGAKTNIYYTHITSLKAGEKWTQPMDVRTAPCRGELNPWELKGSFSSSASGSYDCFNPSAKSAAAQGKSAGLYPAVATASAATQARACSLARELFAQKDRSPQACDCTSHRNGTLFVCKALGRGLAQETGVQRITGDAKALLREVEKCDPATDSRRCERVNGGSGKRG